MIVTREQVNIGRVRAVPLRTNVDVPSVIVEIYDDPLESMLNGLDEHLFVGIADSILTKSEGINPVAIVIDDEVELYSMGTDNYQKLPQGFTFETNASEVYRFIMERERTQSSSYDVFKLIEQWGNSEALYSFLLLFAVDVSGWEHLPEHFPGVMLRPMGKITLSQTRLRECMAELYINPYRITYPSRHYVSAHRVIRFWREQIIDAWAKQAEIPIRQTKSSTGGEEATVLELQYENIMRLEGFLERRRQKAAQGTESGESGRRVRADTPMPIRGGESDVGQEVDYTRLRQMINERFDVNELQTFCFDLNVDYDDLPGESKADKVRELVSYHKRRDSIPKLVEACKQRRPEAPWAKVMN